MEKLGEDEEESWKKLLLLQLFIRAKGAPTIKDFFQRKYMVQQLEDK